MSELEGRTAVVTGAARGLGQAIAIRLAGAGARVVLVDVDANAGAESAAALGDGRGRFVEADVSYLAGARAAAAAAIDAFGRIDILVNNAGIQRYGTVVDTPEAVWDEVLRVNLKSMYLMAHECVPQMLQHGGGAVVNMGSAQAFAAQHGVAAYAASKGGVAMLTRAMAVDFAPTVRANAVCPGSVDTPMLRGAAQLFAADDPEAAVARWGAMHPMGRVAQASEIAEFVCFLAGPRASFLTGGVYLADGGLLSLIPGTA